MMASLKSRLIEPLSTFAFPPVCQVCDGNRADPADGFVCADCQQDVFPIDPPFCHRCGQQLETVAASETCCARCQSEDWAFDSARSMFAARGLVREIVHRFKYNDAEHFLPLIESWMQRFEFNPIPEPDFIVPIPLHPVKERERGFNQAEQMAEMLSRATSVPMKTDVIRRTKFTDTQTHLTRKQRLANMRDAFATEKCTVTGNILLVDDVMTTGATAGACAAVLRGAGAESVAVWTLARGLPF